jgi:putative transposase
MIRHLRIIISYLSEVVRTIKQYFILKSLTDDDKIIQILALTKELHDLKLQMQKQNIPKPQASIAYKQFWSFLVKYHPNWRMFYSRFKPETLKKWRDKKFKSYWYKLSKSSGRPKDKDDRFVLIKQIIKENPYFSAEKIVELLKDLGVIDCPCANSIRKRFPQLKKPPSERQKQSWATFLKNHAKDIWAMDYFVSYDLKFKLLFSLVIINHSNRKIEHIAVTKNPNVVWLKQQIRNSMPFDRKPKYLIHDNDKAFVSKDFQSFLSSFGVTSKRTAFHSPWQNGICERAVGTIRNEILRYIVPLSDTHLQIMLKRYVQKFYNTHRTHQGINCKTPIPHEKYSPITLEETVLETTPILGGLYHTYTRVA